MWNRALLSGFALSLLATLPAVAADADKSPAAPALSAEQVVARNVEARGGLEAWRAVKAITFTGTLEAGGKKNAEIPFRMDLERPRKSRVEVEFAGDRAVQVYDGSHGYKLRPFLNRREIEPFKPEEAKAAAMESELDGPLVDYVAKGTRVRLEGMDKANGRDAYRLELTLKSGDVRRVWIDAETFLEAKIDGTPRIMDGRMRSVEITFSDYRTVGGLAFPFVVESSVDGGRQGHKMKIDHVEVNPSLDDARFTKGALLAAPVTEKPGTDVAQASAAAPSQAAPPAQAMIHEHAGSSSAHRP